MEDSDRFWSNYDQYDLPNSWQVIPHPLKTKVKRRGNINAGRIYSYRWVRAMKNYYAIIAGLILVAGVLAMVVDTTVASCCVVIAIATVLVGSAID